MANLADTLTDLDFAKILPTIRLVLKLVPGDADDKLFAKIEPTLADAARFFNAHKAQLKPLLAGLGLVATLFRHNETNRNQPGEPAAPPILPPVPPIVPPPTTPPVQNPNMIASMDAAALFIEEDRRGENGGKIVPLPRFREIMNADGNDALMLNERIHLDFTPRNASGQEIARETVRAIEGNEDGSPAAKIEYDVRNDKGEWVANQDSKDEDDCFALESQNATGQGRDTDNGFTPVLNLQREHEGRKRARARLVMPAGSNFGTRVASKWVEFWVN